ncbi:MAG: FMN-binding glutamate synthase family protein, partial [Coriobacteriia bacterium]|nr:FMN-binding glutamate synthase family protein [Coriobacteriia bacterium]
GTGMSPWRMMEEWGVPTFYLQCMANELAEKLAQQGSFVPDLAIAGGFSAEDHVFKVLALGSPHTKAVCMGRALMIPGFVGKNIEVWMQEEDLPKSVSQFGGTKEEIFVTYETLKAKYGNEVDAIPLGAIAIYTYADRIKVGLQQLMSGSRNMDIPSISRADLMALTRESSEISGIPFVTDAYRDEAMRIIEG